MNRPKRITAGVFAVLLLVVAGWLQQPIDKLRPQFQEEQSVTKGGAMTNLLMDESLQFIGAAAMGLRQAVAGVLWVRADEFFHKGQYDAIIPLVRMVTWLDPHQIDVYCTGAWHLDYNFVDSDQRSDKRYIPPAIKLMEEGVQNNPGIYDLYFDLAWMHYFQKIKDYDKAVEWMEKCASKPSVDTNTGERIPQPAFVARMLAHAYEKAGNLDKAEETWRKCLADSEAIAKGAPKDRSNLGEVDICKQNLGRMLLRRGWRNGDMAAYEKGINMLKSLASLGKREQQALAATEKTYAEFKAKGSAPHDTLPQIDVHFDASWKKVKSKVLLIEGTLNIGNAEDYKGLASESYTSWYTQNQEAPANMRLKWREGCRVRVVLADDGYDYRDLKTPKDLNWDVDKTQTIVWDDALCREGKFRMKLNLSKDPEIYPLAKDKYKLIVWFDPGDTSEDMQDRIGWRGEGITDKRYLNTTIRPGFRLVRKEFILKKSDIM